MYEQIIIGAGPAGITAGVYAARFKINTLVITKDIGGQTAWSGDIENYTGYQFITGPELTAKFYEHIKQYPIELKENEEVSEIKKKGNLISIKTNKGIYDSKAVIIASGKRSKQLDVSGENEFKNKGLTYCAICDGPLFSGKDVAVIGGGNSALDAAMQLLSIARHIYVIDITPHLSGDTIIQDKIKKSSKVSIFNNTTVMAILGDKMVNGIKIKKDKKEQVLKVEGVFVEIGLIPNSEFAKGIDKNEKGEIKVNSSNETNLEGIFAAGDVTDVLEKQIIIAAGEGSKAALSAFKYLTKKQ